MLAPLYIAYVVVLQTAILKKYLDGVDKNIAIAIDAGLAIKKIAFVQEVGRCFKLVLSRTSSACLEPELKWSENKHHVLSTTFC